MLRKIINYIFNWDVSLKKYQVYQNLFLFLHASSNNSDVISIWNIKLKKYNKYIFITI